MAYNYVKQAFTRYVYETSSSYYTGGNILCGQIKEFILANFPEATLESDNDPPLDAAGGKHTTKYRLIHIKIRGVRKIIIMSNSHGNTVPYGWCVIRFINNTTTLDSVNFGNDTEVTKYLDFLSINNVGYIFKDSKQTFKASYGYILSDEDECIILANGTIFSLNSEYAYTILPTGHYNNYVNGKMIITEMMLKKLDASNQTLRFKNKKIFIPGVSTYFSLDRFYIGDDGHKYCLIGVNNLLVQLE